MCSLGLGGLYGFFTPKVIETGRVAFATFFALVRPIDVAAVYAGLTAGMPAKHR